MDADVSARQRRLVREVGRKTARRQRAEREPDRSVWFSLGLFGLVGWSVVVPTLMGVALGVWIDGRWPGRISWTLTLLLGGIVLGCANAWRWIREETHHGRS
jgi:ATP synthase protein I